MLVLPTLKKYFVFDQVFSLLAYDQNMSKLKEDLLPLVRDSYESNYRFIFLHYDMDYHISNDSPGLTLRNLQKILHSLDISNYFCLVLSQKDLQPHLDQLRIEETNDDCAIACIPHRLQDLLFTLNCDATESNVDLIDAKFLCLNRVRRSHRTLLFALLQERKLLDKGLVSYRSRL
jgi:hypothetical protein